jgi:hypothetical protein
MTNQETTARELDAGNLTDIAAIDADDHEARLAAMLRQTETRQRLGKELKLTPKQLNRLITAELIKRRNKKYR